MSRRTSAGQELVKGPPEQKQRANVYTMMLIISFIAICVACTVLWFELQDYAPYPWWKTEGVSPATSQVVPATQGAFDAAGFWQSRTI